MQTIKIIILPISAALYFQPITAHQTQTQSQACVSENMNKTADVSTSTGGIKGHQNPSSTVRHFVHKVHSSSGFPAFKYAQVYCSYDGEISQCHGNS